MSSNEIAKRGQRTQTGCRHWTFHSQTSGRSLFALLCLFAWLAVAPLSAAAATRTCKGGNMSDASNWQAHKLPDTGDTIGIDGDCILDENFEALAYGALEISRKSSGSLSWPSGSTKTLKVDTVVTGSNGSGTIDMRNGGVLQVTGGWSSSNTALIPGKGTVVWNVSGSDSTLPAGVDAYNNLTVNAGSATVRLARDTTVSGTLRLAGGTLAVDDNLLALTGAPIAGNPNNLSTTSASSLSFSGSTLGAVVPGSVGLLKRLVIDNPNGVQLNGNLTLSGGLDLTRGVLSSQAYTVSVTANCNSAGTMTRNSGNVDGRLRLTFPAGSGVACTYYVGDSANDNAATVTLSSGGGTLTASTVAGEQPQIAASSLDPAKDLNRYWSLWAAGDTVAASSYSLRLNFVASDLDQGASASSLVIAKYAGGAWNTLSATTAGTSSVSVNAIAGPLDARADFAVGETGFGCPVPSGLPSTMTCVCDNFGRSSLNPSTIYGGSWQLSTSGGSFGLPKIVKPGFLRLTDNSNNVATAATLPGIFPAAGNLITVEFKHYAYNGSGADGIALTLSDAAIAPVPGAYGGSLGYAQKNTTNCTGGVCNGFSGGWIGVGIDEYGNYSAASEGRSGGPGMRQNAVAVRGSGSGLNGYPYLGGTSTLSPAISSNSATSPAYGHAYRIMVDARNYTAANKRTVVTVNRDTTGQGNYSTSNQIINFDAYAVNASQAPVPANWKLSFTGSTGSATNIHEIGNVRICAQTIVPPAGYRIEVDNPTPNTCPSTPAGKPVVTITAVDANGNTVTTYDKKISLAALTASGGASSASWSKYSANGTFSANQYTFTPADNGVAKFYLTDTAEQDVYLSVGETGGSLSSALAMPVKFRGGAFSVDAADALGDEVVAGRAHLLTITRSNGCNTLATYTGQKTLDAWYTPAPDHPAGAAAPRLCAPNAGGTCLPATGACQLLSSAQPVADASSNNLPQLTFSNGKANVCLQTADVGKYSLSLRDDTDVSSAVAGTSKAFTARPFAVVVSGIKAGNVDNAANMSPAGAVLTSAGSPFQATVGAYLWSAAGDANGDGLPDPAAGAAAVTGSGLAAHYADNVMLAADNGLASNFAPASPPGKQGTLDGGEVAIAAGSATATALSYSEVGSFTLKAAPTDDYLKSGIDLKPRVMIYASASGQPERRVGRFVPHHFGMSPTPLINRSDLSCGGSSFTYMGEPMAAGFTLTAMSLNGSPTENYSGPYVKFSNSAASWMAFNSNDSIGMWMTASGYAVNGGTCRAVFGAGAPSTTSFICSGTAAPAAVGRGAGPRVSLSTSPAALAPTINWVNGVGTFNANLVLERADAPDGAYNGLSLGMRPVDGDGVTLLSSSLNLNADNDATDERALIGQTRALFGRLRIANTYGSELLPLPVDVQAQYWSGSAWVANVDDACTSLAGPAFSVTPAAGAAVNTSVAGSGTLAAGTGAGRVRLARPTPAPAGKGAVDLSSSLPYLPGTGRETFGVYKGGPVIYLRELHF